MGHRRRLAALGVILAAALGACQPRPAGMPVRTEADALVIAKAMLGPGDATEQAYDVRRAGDDWIVTPQGGATDKAAAFQLVINAATGEVSVHKIADPEEDL